MIKKQRPSHEVILDEVDLRDLLKISEHTAVSLRAKNLIAYNKLGKVHYLLSDVLKMLENQRFK